MRKYELGFYPFPWLNKVLPFLFAGQHGVTFEKTCILSNTIVRTSVFAPLYFISLLRSNCTLDTGCAGRERASAGIVYMASKEEQPTFIQQRQHNYSERTARIMVVWGASWNGRLVPQILCYCHWSGF